ncbi:hypothetical protein RSAG8_02263, partial [Rhizoctonia solani AG-8 WAC10335]
MAQAKAKGISGCEPSTSNPTRISQVNYICNDSNYNHFGSTPTCQCTASALPQFS